MGVLRHGRPARKPSDAAAAPAASSNEGIPVVSELVRAKCGTCHRADDKMRMSRISYRRATPENWEKTIKRMVALNHATLEPADARDHSQVSRRPQRAGAGRGAADRVRGGAPSGRLHLRRGQGHGGHLLVVPLDSRACLSERRTKEEWELLVAMHRGYYPLVDNQPMNGGQGFRRSRPMQTEPGPDGRPPDNRHPMDKALEHLTKALPLNTPEWSGVVGGHAAAEAARAAGRHGIRWSARARFTVR